MNASVSRAGLMAAGMLCMAVSASITLSQVLIQPPMATTGAAEMSTTQSVLPAASAPASQPGGLGGESAIPSAQSVFEQLLKDQEASNAAATAPGNSANGEPAPGSNGLVREGEKIIARSGHLKKSAQGGAMMFVFDETPGEGTTKYPAMAVVPSRRLAAMEDASDFGARPITFQIDAEVTQYRGKNYLYVKPTPMRLTKESTTEPADPDATEPAQTMPSPPSPAPAHLASAFRLQPQVEAVAPTEPPTTRMREAEIISNRVGRLVKDARSGLELFEFDSDGKQMADPPMGVIPCKYLSVMEDATRGGTQSVKFRVSGEVTQYRGKNYLYLRFVQAVRDLHQGLGG